MTVLRILSLAALSATFADASNTTDGAASSSSPAPAPATDGAASSSSPPATVTSTTTLATVTSTTTLATDVTTTTVVAAADTATTTLAAGGAPSAPTATGADGKPATGGDSKPTVPTVTGADGKPISSDSLPGQESAAVLANKAKDKPAAKTDADGKAVTVAEAGKKTMTTAMETTYALGTAATPSRRLAAHETFCKDLGGDAARANACTGFCDVINKNTALGLYFTASEECSSSVQTCTAGSRRSLATSVKTTESFALTKAFYGADAGDGFSSKDIADKMANAAKYVESNADSIATNVASAVKNGASATSPLQQIQPAQTSAKATAVVTGTDDPVPAVSSATGPATKTIAAAAAMVGAMLL